MSRVLNAVRSKAWVAHVDDERSSGNSIIVTLKPGWFFCDEKDSGVRGFDTVNEVRSGLARNQVVFGSVGSTA